MPYLPRHTNQDWVFIVKFPKEFLLAKVSLPFVLILLLDCSEWLEEVS